MPLTLRPRLPTVPFVDGLRAHGARVAVLTDETRLTYADLADAVDTRTRDLGAPRKLVCVAGANEAEALITYLAALVGGHVVMLVPGDDPTKLDALVSAYDPDVVVTRNGDGWSTDLRREESGHDLHPELALLLGTSGSTGASKLVRLSHDNLQANAASIARYLGIRDTDRAATTLPMHYCYGLSVIHSHLLHGAGLVVSTNSVIDRCFWDRFRRFRATTFAGVPHTFDLLDRVGFADMDLPHLRYVTQAGGRLAPERVRSFAELGRRNGWDFFVMYGQTEATARMAYLPPDAAVEHPGAIGVPIPGGSFEIDPVEDFGDGEGELVYRGPNVMLGYARGPSDLALGRCVDELRTGDIARRTPAGFYEIVGRRSRFLKLFGLRIDLDHVEHLLGAGGLDALCKGDDTRLVVALAGDSDAPDSEGARGVRDLLHERIGLPAHSISVITVSEFPRLENGKPDYAAIREHAHGPGSTPRAAGSAETDGDEQAVARLDHVRAVFTSVLDRDDVGDDATFVGLGGDSLSYVEMSVSLEGLLGDLPERWHVTPLRDLASKPGATRRAARPWTRMETNVVLRALAIVLIVGTHAGLFGLKGGAHVLLAIAGYNFARFQLTGIVERDRVGPLVAGIARVAIPSVTWIAAMAVWSDLYGLRNVLLVNTHLGSAGWDPTWRYWFIEALVHILVAVGALFTVPAVRRLARHHPFGLGTTVLLVGSAPRLGVVSLGGDAHPIHTPQNVAWLFALGWVAQRASTTGQRLVVSALAAVSIPGFAADPQREAFVLAGLLLLTWVPMVRVPRFTTRAVAAVAGASLYIYLTHWQVYPPLVAAGQPLPALVASLGVGLVTSHIAGWITARVRERRPPPARRALVPV